jgi:hypothetical protein
MTDKTDIGTYTIGARRSWGHAEVALPALPDGQALLGKVEGYWRGLCSGSLPPSRQDLDSSRFAEALPHAFLVERVAPGVALLRTAGQALCTHLGSDPKGLPLSTLVSAETQPRLKHWLDRCFADPALVDIAVTARRGALRPPMAARLLLLPLRDDRGDVNRALGGIFPVAGAMLSNVRFDLREDATLRCEDIGGARGCSAVYGEPSVRRTFGLAEPKRPFLRLVVSNP